MRYINLCFTYLLTYLVDFHVTHFHGFARLLRVFLKTFLFNICFYSTQLIPEIFLLIVCCCCSCYYCYYYHSWYVANNRSKVGTLLNFWFLDQELISYHYSSYCYCSTCCCWGDLFKNAPKTPSFQIGLGWNLTGLFFKWICTASVSSSLHLYSSFKRHTLSTFNDNKWRLWIRFTGCLYRRACGSSKLNPKVGGHLAPFLY